MRNAFLRDFYFSLQSTVQQRTKKPDKNHEVMKGLGKDVRPQQTRRWALSIAKSLLEPN